MEAIKTLELSQDSIKKIISLLNNENEDLGGWIRYRYDTHHHCWSDEDEKFVAEKLAEIAKNKTLLNYLESL